MNDKNQTIQKITKKDKTQKRFLEAKQDFQKMQKEIAPFIKPRKFKRYSTEGEWVNTSSLYL